MTDSRKAAFWTVLALALAGCGAEVAGATAALGPDADGDGDPDGTDCAPLDPAIHAGATEQCNGIDDDCDSSVDEPVGGSYCVPVSPGPSIAEQCPEGLRMGRMASAGNPCPAPLGPGWRVGRLMLDSGHAPREAYCTYEQTGSGPPPLGSLPPSHDGRPPTAWLQPDCYAVVGLAPTDGRAASEAVHRDYLNGWLDQLDATTGFPGTGALPAATHVAVVDGADGFAPHHTSPAPSRGGVGTPHGAAMGLLIERLACPSGRHGGACTADFTNHLALDTNGDGTRVLDGGVVGSFGQLATMIEEALDARSARAAGPRPLPLVINLSVGAEPMYARVAGVERASVQALRAALDRAACADRVLVVAAAGNATGGPSPTSGPMIPAAWAAETTSCGTPYVLAVGGVDPSDAPLRQGRPGGLPELVAPSQSVSVDRNVGLGSVRSPVPLMTGTSVGAAAASAAAAIVWAYDDRLSAQDVAARLYAYATPVPSLGPADFCDGAACRPIRRLSICGAVQAGVDAGCGLDPALCGVVAPCMARRRSGGVARPVALSPAAWAALPPPAHVASAAGATPDVATSPFCSAPAIDVDASTLPMHPDLCPFEQYPTVAAEPFGDVTSQPEDPACRVCGIDLFDTVYVYLNEDLPGTLYLSSLESSAGDLIDLSSMFPGPLTAGDSYKITGLGLDTSAEWVTLTFVLKDSRGRAHSMLEEVEIW
jgi:hypothetical protein